MRRSTSLALGAFLAFGLLTSGGFGVAANAAGLEVEAPVLSEGGGAAPEGTEPPAEPAPPATTEPGTPTPSEVAAPEPTVSPRAAAAPAPKTEITPHGGDRLSGDDRFATSVEISKWFSPNVPVVYLSTGANFPDALTAAAAAAREGGPLLLTRPDVLPDVVAQELLRLKPARVVVAGAEASVSQAVYDRITQIFVEAVPPVSPPSLVRVGGADRFETAELLNAQAFDWADVAYVATGRSFPDALAASAVAGGQGAPVFLVDGQASSVRPQTLQSLRELGVRTIRIAGDVNAVSAGIASELGAAGFTVRRDSGRDRFATAVALNDAVYGGRASPEQAFLASGTNFPDALAGAALAGQLGAPLYLVRWDCQSLGTSNSLLARSPDERIVLGGSSSVSADSQSGRVCIEWVKPAEGRVTDVYGPRDRICTPGGCTSTFHRGTDLGTGCNRPVYAATSGRISYAGVLGTFGNWVRVAHDFNEDTGYAHLNRIDVVVGQYVMAGQQIGLSGTTGASTGCHLHFEVYVNGTQTDPQPFMAARGAALG